MWGPAPQCAPLKQTHLQRLDNQENAYVVASDDRHSTLRPR